MRKPLWDLSVYVPKFGWSVSTQEADTMEQAIEQEREFWRKRRGNLDGVIVKEKTVTHLSDTEAAALDGEEAE